MKRNGKKRVWECGEPVQVLGKLHPLHGQIGRVLRPYRQRPYWWEVQIEKKVFIVQGRYLQRFKIGGTD